MAMTIEQQRALATAKARKAKAEAAQSSMTTLPNLQGVVGIGPILGAFGYDGIARPAEGEYKPSMVPALDPINAAASKAVESIPVIGPALDRFGNKVDAGFASMVEGKPVTPEDRAAINAADQEQYPFAANTGMVAGTVGPFAAAGASQLGAKALGLTGPMWQRALMGFGTGGAISYADAIARGDSGQSAALKGGLGALTGGALPFAERGASAVMRALMRKGPAKDAQIVARGLERDKIDPAQISARLAALGPDAVLADLGPNMTRQAGAIASLPGQAQTAVREALIARNAGVNRRIQGDVDQTLGPAIVPSNVQGEIRAGQQALGPEYEALFKGQVRSVDTSPIAANLEALAVNERGAAQKAAQKVREMLNVTGTSELDPNPYTLFKTRQAIDGLMNVEQDTGALRVLGDARKQVDSLLAQAVPGIKEVDARFQELALQSKAIDTGQQALEGGRTAPRPQEVAGMMEDGALPAGAFVGPSGVPFRLSQGARAEIERIVGTTANNLTALKSALKGDGSWNRERLASLFGAQKADKLLDVLERELTYQRTFNAVTQNSETAARAAAQKDIAPAQFGERQTSVSDILLRVPQMAANKAAQFRSEGVNSKVAQALMSRPSPEMVDQLLAARALASRRSVLAPAAGSQLITNR